MNASLKKRNRGRGGSRLVENKNNFRNQDGSMNYNEDRKRLIMSDMSIYTIARFLMGCEVQIITQKDKYEGVLKAFDSLTIGLTKVFVYDNVSNDNVSIIKYQLEVREIYMKDILHLKLLNVNGKTDSVIIDQEISQRKQISKSNLNEDKTLVPYFDEDESLIHHNDEGDDLNDTLKGNQNCWYPPEIMLKVNEERFNVKNTFNETMEEYTTPIDKSDPHLKEKIEIAERLAKEIENDNNSKRSHLLDENEGQDEEIIFSAVIPTPTVHPKVEPSSSNSNMKLNPNAPEFRPRQKPVDEIQLEPAEDVQENCQQMMNLDSLHQHRMIQLQHVALQQMSMAPQITPQIQTYPAQQMIQNPQWTLQAPNTGPYVIQPYLPPNQVMQHMMPARQMQQEPVQPGSIYYQFSQPFLIPQDHPLSGSLNDNGTHLYSSNLDAANQQIIHTNSLNQLRQPNFIPHIPMIQTTNPISLHQQQQQQQQPQNPNPQQLNAYYQHLSSQPINSANFSHLIINQPQQQQPLPPQIQNGAGGPTIQGFITNGR